MSQVTYLIGAGASAQALPIVSDMPRRLVDFYFSIRDYSFASGDFNERRIPFLNDLKNLIEALVKVHPDSRSVVHTDTWENKPGAYSTDGWKYSPLHASIDTYARKLSIKKDDRLKDLKILIALFFIFEQWTKRVDNRYDSFFASIIGPDTIEPASSIRIISWNYDYQFELAYKEFSDQSQLSVNQAKLRVLTKRSFRKLAQEEGGFQQMVHKAFSIYKINGTAGFFDRVDGIERFPWENEKDIREGIITTYEAAKSSKSELVPALSFAWEQDNRLNLNGETAIDLARNSIKESKVIVIIGYSVPFFNRKVDTTLFGELNPDRIYIQDLNPIEVKERFQSINPRFDDSKFRLISVNPMTLGQFYLPSELSF